MQEINYIKHLNAVFNQFSKDNRLNPTHISLYIALFQLWNLNRFLEEFFINRDEVMQLSKIGSKSTYHRCIKELNHWKYIVYFPSHNPYRGSKIKMFKFGTSTGQVVGHNSTQIETSSGQALAHSPTFCEKLHFGKRASLQKSWTQSPISAFHSVNPSRFAGKEHYIPELKS